MIIESKIKYFNFSLTQLIRFKKALIVFLIIFYLLNIIIVLKELNRINDYKYILNKFLKLKIYY